MSEPPAPTVQIDFTLSIGEGALQTSLQVPTGTVNMTQFLPVLQAFSGSVVGSAVRAAEREGRSISCKAGCGACCRQLVTLSIFEAEYIAEWIRSLPQERQAVLEQRFAAAVAQLQAGGMVARIRDADWVNEASTIALEYLAQRVACPFLEDESCSIHPIRPLICREYLVTSPAEFCSLQPTDTVVGVRMPLKLSRALYGFGAQLEGDQLGWIPLSFLFLWMGLEKKPGAAIHGPGPAMLHEFLKRLTTSNAPA